MRDDSPVPPLTKRAPGKSSMRRPEPQYTPVVLPESVVQRVRAASGDVLLFSSGHFIRVLADRWLALHPGSLGAYLLLDTASLSALGYDHSLSQPVIRLWNDGHHAAG